MASSLALGWLAGALSTLSPCVLPLLPIILLGATRQGPFGPVALAAGLMISFTAAGILLATVGFALGISGDVVRDAGAFVMAAFGIVLLVPQFQLAFAGAMSAATGGSNALLDRVSPDGLGGNFVLGGVLGLVWAPCTGPTLGAAVGMAAQSKTTLQAVAIMAAFSLGAITPLLVLAYGSRQAIARRRERLQHFAAVAKPAMGTILVALALVIWSGLDKRIETILTEAMPDWLVALTTRF